MAIQITTAMVNQYSANVMHLSQQKESKLKSLVRSESQASESKFYERLGTVNAGDKVGRHSRVTYTEIEHSRRMVTLQDKFLAQLVDEEDKIRLLISPESEYAKASASAMGRAMDDVIIAAALGNAYGGKTGSDVVALPTTQRIYGTTGSGFSSLNSYTLRKIKKLFWENEAGDDNLTIVCSSEEIDAMLGDTQITSSDYAAVKALVNGDVNSFMGFKFVRSERLGFTTAQHTFNQVSGKYDGGAVAGNVIAAASGSRRCFAFHKDGMILAIGKDVTSKIEPLPEMHYATQVYFKMCIGATRLEEKKVVEVITKVS